MKKLTILISILFILNLIFTISMIIYYNNNLLYSKNVEISTEDFDIIKYHYDKMKNSDGNSNYLQGDGYIENATIAVNYAKLIIRDKFGEKVMKEYEPYEAFFIEEDQVWYITGYLPQEMDGGTPNVLIQKTDGKVLSVWKPR